jgi:2-haloacid dehalogenase
MKYKLLIFDADDTLFDFKKAEEYGLRNALKDHSIKYNKEYHIPLYRKINIAIWQEFERGEITQKELKVERFRRFLIAMENNNDPKLFGDSFMDHLSQASFLFDGAQELVEALSKKYRMIIVTNGLTRVQKYRVRESIIAKHFERIIISEEIGYAKPNPMIFEKGLEGIDLPSKSEIVMIGDSLTSDIPGGINYGIDTILYNPAHKDYKETGIRPHYEIHSLESLYNIL